MAFLPSEMSQPLSLLPSEMALLPSEMAFLPSEMSSFGFLSSDCEGARNVVDDEIRHHVTAVAERRHDQRPFEAEPTDDHGREEQAGKHQRR